MVELVKLVEHGIGLAGVGGRADLREHLEHTRRRLLEPDIRVIVVGEFKQGKSQLINALVNAPVCPVDDDIATSVATVVRHGDPPSAFIVVEKNGSGSADASPDPTRGDREAERRPVALGELAGLVSESGNPGNRLGLASAEVHLPRRILSGGLSIMDSPGVGGLDSEHSLTTLSALPTADAMLLVSDASQEYTEPELRFLRQALRICPHVACVLSKTDLYPRWTQVAELNRAHLDRINPGIPLIPVSSELRLHAARLEDRELNSESGFPALVTHLRREVLGRAEAIQRQAVAQELLSATEHLGLSLRSELSALQDPETTPRLIAELEAARQRADSSRQQSARWQTTLNDGISDLIADMEYDLRDRLRTIQREAEEAIDETDPGPIWEQFADWLEQRVAAAVAETFVWTHERAQWLSGVVAEHFTQDEVRLPVLQVADTEGVLDPVGAVPGLDRGHVSLPQKVLIGMRGSYGGVLMFGLLTGIVGMALINPISVGAGLLLGGKAYQEDKEARLKRRQGDAKAIVRRQIDEVVFQVGKQLRDRLRLVQRDTRDHFIEIAEEHHRSLAESVLAAQKAAAAYTLERKQRVGELEAALKSIEALRRHARALEPETPEESPS